MQKTKQCPKCQSTKIIKLDSGCLQSRDFGLVGIFHFIGMKRYVCTQCGYTEEWIEPPPRLKDLADMRPEETLRDLK